LPPGIRQPARQIAASNRTHPAAHSTGISKTRSTPHDCECPHPTAPFHFRFQKCPFSAKTGIHQTKKAALSVLPIKRIGNSDYTFLAEFEGNPVAGIWGEHPIDGVRQLTHFY
jgi:hypothetical protein